MYLFAVVKKYLVIILLNKAINKKSRKLLKFKSIRVIFIIFYAILVT